MSTIVSVQNLKVSFRLGKHRVVEAVRDISFEVSPDPAAPPIWARFYELGTNRPLFMGRDSVPHYALAGIEQERRGGYAFYGDWPASLVEKDYPRWRAKLAATR